MTRPRATSVRTWRRQFGVTLIESLVALLVVSLGTVSVIRLQRNMHIDADLTGQRVEAARLGQGAVEKQRAGAGIAAPLATASLVSEPGRNTRFAIAGSAESLHVDRPDAASYSRVAVSWPDLTGTTRAVTLDTVVAGVSPTLAAALSIRSIDAPLARIAGRSPRVPPQAIDIGGGRSAWQPKPSEPAIWVFDNATGRIVDQCTRAAIASSPTLAATDLGTCVNVSATILSGVVRTSLAVPPDALQANDPPDPMAIVLTLLNPAQAATPTCTTEPARSVEATFGTGASTIVRRQAVPLDATPASIGAIRWTDLGDRFAAYRCIVVTPPGGWSGHTTIAAASTASGPDTPAQSQSVWTIGNAAGNRKICRYVSAMPSTSASASANSNSNANANIDSNSNSNSNSNAGAEAEANAHFNASTSAKASTAAGADANAASGDVPGTAASAVASTPAGAPDLNDRHPADYTEVVHSLSQQNFLVIRGDQACPGPISDSGAATEQQQP